MVYFDGIQAVRSTAFSGNEVQGTFGMPIFAVTGPRHLVLSYANDIFVMPQAINLVKRPAPAITSVRTNADGSATVAGSNFGGDSLVYFDGIQAVRSTAFSGNDLQ